jgi:hypothetical protein
LNVPNFDLNGWIIDGTVNGCSKTICDGKEILGGFNCAGQGARFYKSFTLPPHYSIRINFTFYYIDR